MAVVPTEDDGPLFVLFQFVNEPELVPLQIFAAMFCNLQPRFTVPPDTIEIIFPKPFAKKDKNGTPAGETVTLTVSAGTVAPVVSIQPESVYVRVIAKALAFAGILNAFEPPLEDREPVQSPAELDAVHEVDERFVVDHTIFAVPPDDGSVIFV